MLLVVVLAAAAWLQAPGATAFRLALPGYRFSFPRDHYCHPEFRTEWWYVTGHLRSPQGHAFGYQVTFFRSALKGARSADSSRQIYFAHFALGDIQGKRFRHFERTSRGGLGLAGSSPERLWVWNGSWLLKGRQHPERIRSEAGGINLDLALTPLKKPVIQGQNGISRKGPGLGHASHYYSLTRLRSRGALTVGGRRFEVDGLSWMDHEFSSDALSPDEVGWDWFSIQLEDGTDLMLYAMRLKNGSAAPASSGSLVDATGAKRHLPLSGFRILRRGTWHSPHSGAVYPSGWRVSIPSQGMEMDVTPRLQDQELLAGQGRMTYWEGACRVTGTRQGRPMKGQAYV
ncbi:MAG: lipocalin-like domain-containing protein, partial [Pseudomonadota bacterium]